MRGRRRRLHSRTNSKQKGELLLNYTENYQLNQWEQTDRVLMDDFNSDNQKIEAALGTMKEVIPQIVTGSYSGNGSSSRSISLGFRPKAVFLCAQNGYVGFSTGSFFSYGGLVLDGKLLQNNGYTIAEITNSGFKVFYNEDRGTCTNKSGETYHYIAFQ